MAGDTAANQRLMKSRYLPPCDGPKLQAFKHQDAPIEWLERLDDPEDGASSRGHVFRVRIRNQEYALKVFKFFHPQTESYLLGPIDGADVSDDLLAFHTDPFFAECRAYGRIEGYSTTTPGPLRKRRQPRKQKPKQIRAKIAARCYGFLALKTADENGYLAAQGIDLWSDIDPDDDYRLQAEGSPIRGLVKEYIAPAPAAGVSATLTVRHYNRMLRSIKILNNTMRIIHRRVQAEAFHPHSGLLVSFGTAWTMEPHCIMDVTAEHIAEVWREADLVMFDDMVEEAGFGNRVRALPDLEYVEKLRSSGRMH